MLLIIIEAPGKIQTVLDSARKALNSNQVAVLATGGYLYVLNNKNVGIETSTLKPINEERTRNSYTFEKNLHSFAIKHKPQTLEVWIMTDPDREGEGIAAHAWKICADYLPGIPIKRAYTTELSVQGLQNITLHKEPHQGIVQAHIARRVLDRLLPLSAAHALDRPGDFEGLGRLQTAAIRVVRDKTASWKRYILEGSWKNENKHFHVLEYDENQNESYAKLQAFKNITYDLVTKKIFEVQAPSAHSALSLIVQLIDISPSNIMAVLQQKYMEGFMSYPRTDQRKLGASATYTMLNIAQNIHINHLVREDWQNDLLNPTLKHPAIDGAHPALHPTLNWQPTGDRSLSDEQRIQAEVAARALAQILKPAKIEQTIATLMTEKGQLFNIAHTEIIEAGWTLAYERAGLQNPLLPKQTLGQRYPKIKEQLPTKNHVIEWMMDEKIGRPATLSVLPSKMQNQGLLSSACVTTNKADQQLQKLANIMPAYTYAGFTLYMEKALEVIMDDPSTYTDMVKNVLVQAGADVVGIAAMMQDADIYNAPAKIQMPQSDMDDISM